MALKEANCQVIRRRIAALARIREPRHQAEAARVIYRIQYQQLVALRVVRYIHRRDHQLVLQARVQNPALRV